jgi:probable nitrogen fixation protein
MSQVLTLNQPKKSSEFQHPFLQELIKQIRDSDAVEDYCKWSDEFLINQLILSSNQRVVSPKKIISAPLNQVLTSAFYKAIGATIERQTGHPTNTFINLRDRELSSAVICCGGVLVLSSLMWGYLSFGFLSLQQLIELAETNIADAVTKASQYLDFVY